MKSRGVWESYTPNEIPFGMPINTLFWRRKSDGVDLYEWTSAFYEIDGGVDNSGTVKVAAVNGFASCVSTDVSMLSLPSEFELIEMDEGEEAPGLGWSIVEGAFTPPVSVVPVKFVYQVDFWSRMTDEEAHAVKQEMDSQPFRLRRIFESAGSYREDHELWPLLSGLAEALFGEARAKEILAPSA